MPKKQYIISSLVLFTILFIAVLLIKPGLQREKPSNKHVPPTPITRADTTLTLSPQHLLLTGSQGTVTVIVNTQSNAVTGVQLEMQYDPQKIENVLIANGTFIKNPLVLKNAINKKTGRITYILGVAPTEHAVTGQGTIAVITFTKKYGASGTTDFQILKASEIAAEGTTGNVLGSISGGQISL